VIACASAGEALEKIQEWNPSVLISDIGMPGDDGYAFMRKVRAIPTLQKPVRAIALTAYARPEDRMRALASGFHMHVPKPVELAELLMVVATLPGALSSRPQRVTMFNDMCVMVSATLNRARGPVGTHRGSARVHER
jgi:CheY-like chemotaxis protein